MIVAGGRRRIKGADKRTASGRNHLERIEKVLVVMGRPAERELSPSASLSVCLSVTLLFYQVPSVQFGNMTRACRPNGARNCGSPPFFLHDWHFALGPGGRHARVQRRRQNAWTSNSKPMVVLLRCFANLYTRRAGKPRWTPRHKPTSCGCTLGAESAILQRMEGPTPHPSPPPVASPNRGKPS